MQTIDLLGKIVTDIFIWSKPEVGGLDQAEVVIELNHKNLVSIPFGLESEVSVSTLPKGAESLFSRPLTYPVWLVNKDGKSIQTIIEEQNKRVHSFWGKLKRFLGINTGNPKAYSPYGIEYRENRFHNLKDQTITDLLVYEDSTNKGFIELGNGMLFTEVATAPHGTGHAGLHWFENLQALEKRHGTDYQRLSEIFQGERE